MFPKFR